MAPAPRDDGPRAALAVGRFRFLITIQLVNAVAVWVHVVAVQWTLTERGESATIVSLAPAALALPFLVLALPAGVVVGYAARERLMMCAVSASALAAATAVVVVGPGDAGTWPLLATVLVVGLALVVVGVAWQSLLPETLERPLVPAATVVDGAVYNIARAVGPLGAGVLLGLHGPGLAFSTVLLLFASCALALAVVQRRWPGRRNPRRPILPAIADSLRFVRHSPWTKRLLVRMTMFGLPASALWALVSLAAHDRLGLGSAGFGVLMTLLGIGAVAATVVLAPLRRRLSVRDFAALGSVGYALTLMVLGVATQLIVAAPFLVIGGLAWVGVQSTWMMLAHQALPDWVRPRVIALLLLLFQGTQAIGALAWGVVADLVGLSPALLLAAGLMLVSVAVLLHSGLGSSVGIEPFPGEPDAAATAAIVAATHEGALEVSYTYEVDAEQVPQFLDAMAHLRRQRLRLGARHWQLARGAPPDPISTRSRTESYTESYAVTSRHDLLEQETVRMTVPEQRVRTAVTTRSVRVAGPRLQPRVAAGTDSTKEK
ncbi:MFS transporter [Nocardioides sp. GXZ039]|uniref:MFS transporter n=1 Tax=Nocardioides sp. GXZ039 TaxID=3136018 RepID=UPI0030F41FF0